MKTFIALENVAPQFDTLIELDDDSVQMLAETLPLQLRSYSMDAPIFRVFEPEPCTHGSPFIQLVIWVSADQSQAKVLARSPLLEGLDGQVVAALGTVQTLCTTSKNPSLNAVGAYFFSVSIAP